MCNGVVVVVVVVSGLPIGRSVWILYDPLQHAVGSTEVPRLADDLLPLLLPIRRPRPTDQGHLHPISFYTL